MNDIQIYTQLIRSKIKIDYVGRKRVQSAAKKLNNGDDVGCLFVCVGCEWVTGWFACCLCK